MQSEHHSQDEETLPMDNGLQGFGRGLYVSTGDAEGVIPLAQQVDALGHIADGFYSLNLGNALPSSDHADLMNRLPLLPGQVENIRADEVNTSPIAAMRKHLNRMVEHVHRYQPEKTSHFRLEMDNFFELFTRYLVQKNNPPLEWAKVNNIPSDKVSFTFTPIYWMIAVFILDRLISYFGDVKGRSEQVYHGQISCPEAQWWSWYNDGLYRTEERN